MRLEGLISMNTKPVPSEECYHKGQNNRGQPKNNKKKNNANLMQRHKREIIVYSIVCKELMFCLGILL